MKTDPDIPRIVRSWLRTDEHEDASRVLDNVLGLLDSTPQRRAWWPARRLPHVNTPIRIAVAIAAVVVVALVVVNLMPRTAAVGGPPATAVPTVSPSAQPSASLQATHMTVAGTGVNGPALGLTVQLPQGWGANEFVADRGTSSAPSGMAFVVSEVDNTFADPCAHTQRSPKVGSTVADLATALGEIPNTTATAPVQTTIAGHPATYIEIAVPASLPCDPSNFYLWQDSPNAYWWVQGYGETARVWILEVGGTRVTFLTHSYPGSSANARAEFETILNSVVFDVPSTQPSTSPAAS